ncbi:MAG: hypothetical protein U5R31_08065 [Acidimicrobiia bacterium]|nr:hypothetical protein [Acidimicrobiia bacterium]
MSLGRLGLRRGDRVRFRRRDGERWKAGVVERLEADGSIGLRDGRGAWRAIPVELVEVRAEGPRGGDRWEPVTERAARTEQLHLW